MCGWRNLLGGCDLGGRLDLLLENEDDGQDIELDNFWYACTRGVLVLSGLRKQDGKVAFFVLVPAKKDEKEKDHFPEGSHVVTSFSWSKGWKNTQVGSLDAIYFVSSPERVRSLRALLLDALRKHAGIQLHGGKLRFWRYRVGTGSQPCSDSVARIVVASRPARDEGVGRTAELDFDQMNFGQTTKPLSGRSTLANISVLLFGWFWLIF